MGVLSMILFGALAALLILVGIVLLLIVRQAAVIILVLLAPLAFAMAILPNTNSLFKKWRKAFIGILILYPELSILFGACALAANIFSQQSNWVMRVGALIISIVPMILIWPIMKGSLNSLGKIGGAISGRIAGTAGKYASINRKRAGVRAGGVAGRGVNKALNSAALKKVGEKYKGSSFGRTRFGKAIGNGVSSGNRWTQGQMTHLNAIDSLDRNRYDAQAQKDDDALAKLATFQYNQGTGKFAGMSNADKQAALKGDMRGFSSYEKKALAEGTAPALSLEDHEAWFRNHANESEGVIAKVVASGKTKGYWGAGTTSKILDAAHAGSLSSGFESGMNLEQSIDKLNGDYAKSMNNTKIATQKKADLQFVADSGHKAELSTTIANNVDERGLRNSDPDVQAYAKLLSSQSQASELAPKINAQVQTANSDTYSAIRSANQSASMTLSSSNGDDAERYLGQARAAHEDVNRYNELAISHNDAQANLSRIRTNISNKQSQINALDRNSKEYDQALNEMSVIQNQYAVASQQEEAAKKALSDHTTDLKNRYP